MSIAALKSLLFGHPQSSPRLLSSDPHSHSYGTTTTTCKSRSSSTASSSSTITSTDLEAQQLPLSPSQKQHDSSKKPPGFRITARVISDATIGLSDGLTVPFALTAGLSALGNTRVVVYGGLAELIAGAISMGLGGYLGAKSEIASYHETRLQTATLLSKSPQAAEESIRSVFEPYGLPAPLLNSLTTHLVSSPSGGRETTVDFLTRFAHCAEEPSSSRALTSATTIALAYFLGGLVPLLPYFCVGAEEVMLGLWISVAVMAVALFGFGYVKTCVVTGWRGRRAVGLGFCGGAQMMVVGGAAAGAAMGLVMLFDRLGGS
ncbi:CCC1 protein [Coniochaeta sp. 2T2.1]|nr:CCC1 protein [Coniochaeta sp. 2T2.1]